MTNETALRINWKRVLVFVVFVLLVWAFFTFMRIEYLEPSHALYVSSIFGTESVYTTPGLKLIFFPVVSVKYTFGDIGVYFTKTLYFIYDGKKVVLNKNFDHVYALTRNQLWVKVDVYLVFHLLPTQGSVLKMYHMFPASNGTDSIRAFVEAILTPTVISCVKDTVASKTITEIVEERAVVSNEIRECILKTLQRFNDVINVKKIEIGQIYVPETVLKAIEEKIAQNQLLEAMKYKAKQKIVLAQAEANSTLIRFKALAESLKLLKENGGERLALALILSQSNNVNMNVIYGLGNVTSVIPILGEKR